MHLMTFDPNCDFILGFPFGQQGKISPGVFAYIDKPSGTLCPKSAHTSKKISLKTPVYFKQSRKRLCRFSIFYMKMECYKEDNNVKGVYCCFAAGIPWYKFTYNNEIISILSSLSS